MLDLQMGQNRTAKYIKNFSKYLSYILRHNPEDIGLKLEKDGWVSVDKLIDNMHLYGNYIIDLELLKYVVDTDEKGRYSFKGDFDYIRANQGHSIKDLEISFKEYTPVGYLYHGTALDTVGEIFNSGAIKPMSRQYVHLSKDIETAKKVGSRHGKEHCIVLKVDAIKMYMDGLKLYESENGVVLCEEVPTGYVDLY